MMNREYSGRVVVSSAAVAGVLVGAGVLGAVISNDPRAAEESSTTAKSGEAAPPGVVDPEAEYERNRRGQTLGEMRVGSEPPDLVSASTGDGRAGYVYYRDLAGPRAPANTPDEAARVTAERLNDRGEIVVPVYAVDGETRIGTFTAGSVEVE